MLFIDRYGESAAAALDALSGGGYAARLEREIEARAGKPAVAVCSVDAAVHTALHLCGVKDGDYVFLPSFTFYSYIAAAENMGGVPVFLDCDPITRCVSPAALDAALLWAELQSKPPAAVVIDDAFGSVADYDVLLPLCKAHNVPSVELAVEGALCGGRRVPRGANCEFGVIGFDRTLYGGGGAVLCDERADAEMFTRARYSDGENHDYRLHNTVAALDLAAVAVAEKIAKRARRNLDAICRERENVAKPTDGDCGKYALCKPPCGVLALRAAGVNVKRPPCVHKLPRYASCAYFEHEPGYSVCESFADYCLVDMDMSVWARLRLSKMLKE